MADLAAGIVVASVVAHGACQQRKEFRALRISPAPCNRIDAHYRAGGVEQHAALQDMLDEGKVIGRGFTVPQPQTLTTIARTQECVHKTCHGASDRGLSRQCLHALLQRVHRGELENRTRCNCNCLYVKTPEQVIVHATYFILWRNTVPLA